MSAPLVGKLQSDRAIQGLAEGWPPCGAGKKKGRQEQVFQNARTALLETVPVREGRTAAKAQGRLLPDWEIGGFSAAELALSQYGVEQRPERLGRELQTGWEGKGMEKAVRDWKWEGPGGGEPWRRMD